MSWRRVGRIARELGPYVVSGVVLWRMAEWEQAMARFVAHGQRVFEAASANIAQAATELHEEAVQHGASKN